MAFKYILFLTLLHGSFSFKGLDFNNDMQGFLEELDSFLHKINAIESEKGTIKMARNNAISLNELTEEFENIREEWRETITPAVGDIERTGFGNGRRDLECCRHHEEKLTISVESCITNLINTRASLDTCTINLNTLLEALRICNANLAGLRASCNSIRTSLGSNLVEIDGYYYFISTSTDHIVPSWYAARDECAKRGMSLAYGLDETRRAALVDYIGLDGTVKLDFWLGATDFVTEGTFNWVETDTPGFNILFDDDEFWMEGQPNGDDDQNCLRFESRENGDFGYNDYECDEYGYYICQVREDCRLFYENP